MNSVFSTTQAHISGRQGWKPVNYISQDTTSTPAPTYFLRTVKCSYLWGGELERKESALVKCAGARKLLVCDFKSHFR